MSMLPGPETVLMILHESSYINSHDPKYICFVCVDRKSYSSSPVKESYQLVRAIFKVAEET